jgi:uncharacterized membrane protein YheB (UPF0754 family)
MSELTVDELKQKLAAAETRESYAHVAVNNLHRKVREARNAAEALVQLDKLDVEDDDVRELLRILEVTVEVEKTYEIHLNITVSGTFDINNLPSESDVSIESVYIDGSYYDVESYDITDMIEES